MAKLFDAAEGADAKAKSQAAWAAFAKDASGTVPGKMSAFTPRERLELVKNAAYWDKARVPKVDKMVLLPMPEANARTAALLSGQVRLGRGAGTGCGCRNQAARLRDPEQRGAACLAVAVLSRRRFALERIRVRKARQSLRRSRRPQRRVARRPDGARDRHVRARPSMGAAIRPSRSSTTSRPRRS